MKKVLVTLAAIGLMAGTAINYAAADVTVYGRAHLSVDSLNNGSESSTYLSSNASRLGFKGTQELSNGLTGEFQYEVSYDPTGGGLGGARTNFLALSGDFGKLVLGKLDAPMKAHMDGNQMFGDQVGDAGNFLGGSGRVNRYSNAIVYCLPTIQEGLKACVGLVPEEGAKNTGGVVFGADYTTGPVFVGLGYVGLKKSSTPIGTADQKTTQLLASYKVTDALRLMTVYQTTTNLGGTSTAKLAVVGVGAAYSCTPEVTVKGHYYTAGKTASDAKNGATMLAAGVDYALSKTTTVYVAYAAVTNEDNANYTPLNWGHGESPAISSGKDPSGISIGTVHKF